MVLTLRLFDGASQKSVGRHGHPSWQMEWAGFVSEASNGEGVSYSPQVSKTQWRDTAVLAQTMFQAAL